jgi:hypothetical protein
MEALGETSAASVTIALSRAGTVPKLVDDLVLSVGHRLAFPTWSAEAHDEIHSLHDGKLVFFSQRWLLQTKCLGAEDKAQQAVEPVKQAEDCSKQVWPHISQACLRSGDKDRRPRGDH